MRYAEQESESLKTRGAPPDCSGAPFRGAHVTRGRAITAHGDEEEEA